MLPRRDVLADLHHLLSGIVGQLRSLSRPVRLGSTRRRRIPDIVGVSLRQRLRAVTSRQVKLGALAVLVVYAVVMLWPYLAATLVRGSAVTAWTNVATRAHPRPHAGTSAQDRLQCRARRRHSRTGQRAARSRPGAARGGGVAGRASARPGDQGLSRGCAGDRSRPPRPHEALRRAVQERARRRHRRPRCTARRCCAPRWPPPPCSPSAPAASPTAVCARATIATTRRSVSRRREAELALERMALGADQAPARSGRQRRVHAVGRLRPQLGL